MSERGRVVFYLLNYGSSIRNMVKGGVIPRMVEGGCRFIFFCVNERDRRDLAEALPEGSYAFEELGPVRYRGWPRWLQRLRTYIWRGRINYRELRELQRATWTWVVTLQIWLGYALRWVPQGWWERAALWGGGVAAGR